MAGIYNCGSLKREIFLRVIEARNRKLDEKGPDRVPSCHPLLELLGPSLTVTALGPRPLPSQSVSSVGQGTGG